MAHVLDLTTQAPERATIAIDGTAYPLATSGDLSISEQMRIARAGARYGGLTDATLGDLTDEQIDGLSNDVRSAARALLLEADDEVFGKLTDEQCLLIVQAFGQEAPKTKGATSSRTSRSSRASNASTAAARKSGQG